MSIISQQNLRREIEELIASEGLHAGDQLPTERKLSELLNLSRAGVRRLLDELDAEGRITRHVGRGTFLLDHPSEPSGQQTSPSDVMHVRRLLEPAVARTIVTAANQADLDELERCLVRCEAAATFEEFERWDAALHRAMVAATHSPLLQRLYDVIDVARNEPLWGVLKQRSYSAENRADYERDHRQIVEAISARDPEAAERAVFDHVDRVARNLLR